MKSDRILSYVWPCCALALTSSLFFRETTHWWEPLQTLGSAFGLLLMGLYHEKKTND